MRKKLGIYIHIPFCKTLCAYCAFPTVLNKGDRIADYVDALSKEITQRSKLFQDYSVDTIYFGGGTPSLLSSEHLERILLTVNEKFNLYSNVNIEIECNPESLNDKKIESFKKLAITRISLGIQSLNDKTLWKIARPHNSSTSVKALTALQKNNWKNFGCDLIIGLPYQTIESFKQDLVDIIAFNPTHISTYFLSYDTKRIDSFIEHSPSEEDQIEMYLSASKFLESQDFSHYEVSNFAKPGHESRHNLKYWNQEEYLGLGLGAHSFYNQTVFENNTIFEEYINNPSVRKDNLTLDHDLLAKDKIMLNLRKHEGLNIPEFQAVFGHNRTNNLLSVAENLIKSNHLRIIENNLSCTNQGWLILNRITSLLCN